MPRKSPSNIPYPCALCGEETFRNDKRQVVCERNCRFSYPDEWKFKEKERLLKYWKNHYYKNHDAKIEKARDRYNDHREMFLERLRKYYHNQSPTRKILNAAIARCYVATNGSFHDYGGRGIVVCNRWLGPDGLKNFEDDMPSWPGPGYSLERENVDGNYEPGNCKWATAKEQANNRRSTLTNRLGIPDDTPIHYHSIWYSLKDFAEAFGINLKVAKYRWSKKGSPDWTIRSSDDKRNFKWMDHDYNVVELSLMTDVPYRILFYRLTRLGWSTEEAMTKPVLKKGRTTANA